MWHWTACKISVSLSFFKFFYHISELMLPTLIQRYNKKSFHFWSNDQTDLQCQTARRCHHKVQWATCAAWHWGSGPHSEGEKTDGMDMWNAPIVQSKQALTYRLMERVDLGGLRWHGNSWQRGIAESGSSRPSTLMIDIPGDLVWDLPCVQQASYLEGGPLVWMLPLYLHVNKKSHYDIWWSVKRKRDTNWNFTGCQMPHFMIVLILYINLLNLSWIKNVFFWGGIWNL